MKKSYIDSPHGQIHVRHWPLSDAPTILLLHWTPFSGRMYEGLAPHFVAAGYNVLAPDMLGYGRSDRRPDAWTVADWAEGALSVLEAFDCPSAAVLGGHNGASIAAECAISGQGRVSHVVLDGCAILTPELRAAFKAMVKTERPRPSKDDDVSELVWSRVERLWQEYIPGFKVSDETIEMMWPAMLDYLETDFQTSAPVSGSYALDERLPLIQQKTLLLGAARDTLASTFDAAHALLPHAQSHFFEGDHPLHFREKQKAYSEVVLNFLAQ